MCTLKAVYGSEKAHLLIHQNSKAKAHAHPIKEHWVEGSEATRDSGASRDRKPRKWDQHHSGGKKHFKQGFPHKKRLFSTGGTNSGPETGGDSNNTNLIGGGY